MKNYAICSLFLIFNFCVSLSAICDTQCKPDPLLPELLIQHINVGQGDATLILGPHVNGRRVSVLLDAGDIPMGGDKDGGSIVANALTSNDVQQLDYFIASHYDADHIGGVVTGRNPIHGSSFIIDLRGQLRVMNVIDRGQEDEPSSKTYAMYERIVEAHGARFSIDTQEKVNSFAIDLGGGASILCYASNGFVRGRGAQVPLVDTENERSLCFLVSYGGFDYLIGGDTIGRKAGRENAKVELAIANSLLSDRVEVDVYHVNHHGANNGSSSRFLDIIQPETAVISVGSKNRHGHPHVEVLSRLKKAGVLRIFQTELGAPKGFVPSYIRPIQTIANGDVILQTDGLQYSINGRFYSVDD